MCRCLANGKTHALALAVCWGFASFAGDDGKNEPFLSLLVSGRILGPTVKRVNRTLCHMYIVSARRLIGRQPDASPGIQTRPPPGSAFRRGLACLGRSKTPLADGRQYHLRISGRFLAVVVCNTSVYYLRVVYIF